MAARIGKHKNGKVTLRAISAHLTVSAYQLQGLYDKGALKPDMTLDEHRVAYISYLRSQITQRVVGGNTRGSGPLVDEKARLVSAQARRVELANLVSEGKLVDVGEEILRQAQGAATLRDMFMALPVRYAPDFAARWDADVDDVLAALEEAVDATWRTGADIVGQLRAADAELAEQESVEFERASAEIKDK